jgi:hypothetical protein
MAMRVPRVPGAMGEYPTPNPVAQKRMNCFILFWSVEFGVLSSEFSFASIDSTFPIFRFDGALEP